MHGDTLSIAIEMAARAHRGQVDKVGAPYVLHPIRVMLAVREQGHREVVQAAAVLHDTVEDTAVTLDEITALSPEVAVLVDAVTRRIAGATPERYMDFISRAASNPEARTIKLADVVDNLDRLDQVPPAEAESLRRRYVAALEVLQRS